MSRLTGFMVGEQQRPFGRGLKYVICEFPHQTVGRVIFVLANYSGRFQTFQHKSGAIEPRRIIPAPDIRRSKIRQRSGKKPLSELRLLVHAEVTATGNSMESIPKLNAWDRLPRRSTSPSVRLTPRNDAVRRFERSREPGEATA